MKTKYFVAKKRAFKSITYFLIACFLFFFQFTTAQNGGHIYDFLNLTPSARFASLGGQQISIYDNDINAVFHNPSLLSNAMDMQLAMNYSDYLSDIYYATLNMAKHFEGVGNFAFGLQYFDYQDFQYADVNGYRNGETFTAMDYTFNISYSTMVIDSTLSVGGTVKTIFSDYEDYFSFGVALDFGATYLAKNKLFTSALVVKNLGTELITYNNDDREPLPFEIQLGVTQKLQYAPFRFSFLATHLETWDLKYKTAEQRKEDTNPETGIESQDKSVSAYADNFFRHIVVGFEFIPSKSFIVSAGYNYKRRKELMLEDAPVLTGFSIGVALNLRRFSIAYGRQNYHVAGGANNFTLRLNLDEFGKKF